MKTIRCAIYTRKSTEEGLEQEFNSLDAQRESGEAFVLSMKHEGWTALPEPYDDGGFTGGNMDRPALKQLMADIERGRIDCVVVYKVDRLSRSLLDFARMMEVFEKHNVSFVSVTQQFNTASSMGRLILNVLLSFAQFERDMISERTSDKMSAARRKGKYVGGRPVLGYEVVDKKLIPLPEEAERVRQIFELYLKMGALLPTVQELNRRGWIGKRYVTATGRTIGGKPFNKVSVYNLLSNVAYVGQIKHNDVVYEGEHDGIVNRKTFDRVHEQLASNGRNGGCKVRNKHGALLRGLLKCGHCDCAMSHSFSTKGSKRYRYYVCTKAQKQGWSNCPSPSVPAGEIERVLVKQIARLGQDSDLVKATFGEVQKETRKQVQTLSRETTALERQIAIDNEEIRRLAICGVRNEAITAGLADLDERVRKARRRIQEIQHELNRLEASEISKDDVRLALADFASLWKALNSRKRSRIFELLIERVEFHGGDGQLEISFHPTGIKAFAIEREEKMVCRS